MKYKKKKKTGSLVFMIIINFFSNLMFLPPLAPNCCYGLMVEGQLLLTNIIFVNLRTLQMRSVKLLCSKHFHRVGEIDPMKMQNSQQQSLYACSIFASDAGVYTKYLNWLSILSLSYSILLVQT